jgi:hypothetical protein
MKWLGLAALVVLASALHAQDDTLRVVGRRAGSPVAAHTRRGYPAYPVTVLEALGGRIVDRGQAVTVHLFGDTLRFHPTWATFVTRGVMGTLPRQTFRSEGVLFLPAEFFMEWLPQRYPERLVYDDGALAPPDEPAAAPVAALDESAADQPGAPPWLGRAPNDGTAQARPRRRAGPAASLRGESSSVYDSNIDHDAAPLAASVGWLGRATLGLQSGRSNPLIEAAYRISAYRFTNTERWNRTTHDVHVEAGPPPLGPIRPTVSGGLRIGSATEDQEVADQYILELSTEVRMSRAVRLTLFGTHRERRYQERVDRDETNRYAGMAFRHSWTTGGTWELGGRYEVNDADRADRRYTRWYGQATLRVPLARRTGITLGLRHSQREYPDRPVDDTPGAGNRQDRRWEPSAAFSQRVLYDRLELLLSYGMDVNGSTELDERYRAHRAAFTIRWRS